MKFKTVIIVTMSICIAMATSSFAKEKGGGKHFVFNLVGTDGMYLGTVPDIGDSPGGLDGIPGSDPAFCFDVDLVNLKNQQVIGTATDCLSDIQGGVNGGLALVGTTIFNLPSGTLITRGNTTVQQVNPPTVTPDGFKITHTTGASGDDNAILSGTGQFKNATGTARLSGMVDLTDFTAIEGDPIFFDCLFVVNLD